MASLRLGGGNNQFTTMGQAADRLTELFEVIDRLLDRIADDNRKLHAKLPDTEHPPVPEWAASGEVLDWDPQRESPTREDA